MEQQNVKPNDSATCGKPMLADGLTLEEWIKIETREQKGKFWGESYKFKPVVARTVLGDGQQLIYFGTIDQRPYYWLMRIDSEMDIESDDFDIETLLEPLEEEFGQVPAQFCLSKKEFNEIKNDIFYDKFEDYKEYQEACQYPAINYSGGHYGLIVNMVTGKVGWAATSKPIR